MTAAERALRAAREGAHEGLAEIADQILSQAARNVGVGDPSEDPNPAVTLSQSGRVDWLAPNVCEVVFATPYAAKQELDQGLAHPRGGGAQYLQRALTEVMPRMENMIAGEIRAQVTSRRRR